MADKNHLLQLILLFIISYRRINLLNLRLIMIGYLMHPFVKSGICHLIILCNAIRKFSFKEIILFYRHRDVFALYTRRSHKTSNFICIAGGLMKNQLFSWKNLPIYFSWASSYFSICPPIMRIILLPYIPDPYIPACVCPTVGVVTSFRWTTVFFVSDIG